MTKLTWQLTTTIFKNNLESPKYLIDDCHDDMYSLVSTHTILTYVYVLMYKNKVLTKCVSIGKKKTLSCPTVKWQRRW